MKPVVSREALDGVQQMHRLVHVALEALVNQDDRDMAAAALRQLDADMVDWINAARHMR